MIKYSTARCPSLPCSPNHGSGSGLKKWGGLFFLNTCLTPLIGFRKGGKEGWGGDTQWFHIFWLAQNKIQSIQYYLCCIPKPNYKGKSSYRVYQARFPTPMYTFFYMEAPAGAPGGPNPLAPTSYHTQAFVCPFVDFQISGGLLGHCGPKRIWGDGPYTIKKIR